MNNLKTKNGGQSLNNELADARMRLAETERAVKSAKNHARQAKKKRKAARKAARLATKQFKQAKADLAEAKQALAGAEREVGKLEKAAIKSQKAAISQPKKPKKATTARVPAKPVVNAEIPAKARRAAPRKRVAKVPEPAPAASETATPSISVPRDWETPAEPPISPSADGTGAPPPSAGPEATPA